MKTCKKWNGGFFQVHERTEEMDFLLLVVRKLLRTNSQSVKVSSKHVLVVSFKNKLLHVFDLQRVRFLKNLL